MKRFWIFTVLFALAFGGMMLMARSTKKDWTTSSKDALEEFYAGQDARMKLYEGDALGHFETAIDLDPDFAAAKLAMLWCGIGRDRRESLVADLETADLSSLTAREQFLIRFQIARAKGRAKEAKQILRSYNAAYPNDPYGLAAAAEMAWYNQDWDLAEKLYKKLLNADPNWVQAQNRLGYIAMARGRFDEAEEQFKTYQYIAPDQANPHDSMGELLTVLGRYEEARAELERALEIRPDFCASYFHLVEVDVLAGTPENALATLDRAAEHCDPDLVEYERCQAIFWSDYMKGDYDAPWREERAECREKVGPVAIQIHRMAALSGRFAEAEKMEQILAAETAKERDLMAEEKHMRGFLEHLRGVRQLIAGDTEAAVKSLEKADAAFDYWGQDQSILKVFNQLNLALAYEMMGMTEGAERVLAQAREVNPKFAEIYPSLRRSVG